MTDEAKMCMILKLDKSKYRKVVSNILSLMEITIFMILYTSETWVNGGPKLKQVETTNRLIECALVFQQKKNQCIEQFIWL